MLVDVMVSEEFLWGSYDYELFDQKASEERFVNMLRSELGKWFSLNLIVCEVVYPANGTRIMIGGLEIDPMRDTDESDIAYEIERVVDDVRDGNWEVLA